MAKASPAQTSFTAGEMSPLTRAREDIDNYRKGLSTCKNFYPLIQGPITRRPGTSFINRTKFRGTKAVTLLPFEFSTEQAYVLELGDDYMWFYTLQGLLTINSYNVTSITKGTIPVVTTSAPHGYFGGEFIIFDENIGGMHQMRLRTAKVKAFTVTATTFEIETTLGTTLDTTNFDTYTSGGTVNGIANLGTPWDETQVGDVKTAQTSDLLFMFHPDVQTRVLRRLSATSFQLDKVTFADGPYDVINTTATTLTPAATTGTIITVTASSPGGINDNQGFLSTDVGRTIRLQHSGTWGWAVIESYTSSTQVQVDIYSDFGATTATTEWRLGLFSDTTGWPSCGTFFEDRLAVGGATSYPQNIALSRTSQYLEAALPSILGFPLGVTVRMDPTDPDGTVTDSHSVNYTLNAKEVNRVRWIQDDEKALLVGTTGGEWVIRPSQASQALTPSNVSGKRSTFHGSADVDSLQSGFSTLFVTRSGDKLREIVYEDSVDGFSAPDVTILAEHLFRLGMDGLTYQQNPGSIVFSWLSNGVFLGFTYERDAQVFAWHQHVLGGVGDASGNAPKVLAMATIPTVTGEWDETYLIVERYIDGTVERNVELLTKVWQTGDDLEDSYHLDGGITQNQASATDIEGIWFLEGETLSVFLDGAIIPDKTVTDGKIELGTTGTIATIGYPYNSDAVLLPFVDGAEDGSALTKVSTINRLGLRLLDTLGLKVGPDDDNLDEILARVWGGTWGVPTQLFTGVVRDSFDGDYGREQEVFLRADGPFPATVLAVTRQGMTEDDT